MGKVKQNQVSKKKQQEKPRDTNQTITHGNGKMGYNQKKKWNDTESKTIIIQNKKRKKKKKTGFKKIFAQLKKYYA